MSGRVLFAGLVGVLVGVGIAIAGSAIADRGMVDDGATATRVVIITSFTPDEPWTEDYAQAGIHKLSADYTRDAIEGFQSKTFVGDFNRNEFGGVYRFATEDALQAFLAGRPPAANRAVKVYRALGEWKAADVDAH